MASFLFFASLYNLNADSSLDLSSPLNNGGTIYEFCKAGLCLTKGILNYDVQE